MEGTKKRRRKKKSSSDIWAKRADAGSIFEMEAIPDIIATEQTEEDSKCKLNLISSGHRLTKVARGHRCEGCKIFRTSKFSSTGRIMFAGHTCPPSTSSKGGKS